MTIWLATLAPFTMASARGVVADDLVIEPYAQGVRFGIAEARGFAGIGDIRAIMAHDVCRRADGEARLVWTGSSMAVAVSELAALLKRWDETGEPPVLSIIALELGDARHATCGLTDFAGFELSVSFDNPERARDAARTIVRLARHVMLEPEIDTRAAYEGLDSAALTIDWSGAQRVPPVVNISF